MPGVGGTTGVTTLINEVEFREVPIVETTCAVLNRIGPVEPLKLKLNLA